MSSLASLIAMVWRLSAPYFRSEDKVAGIVLLASVVACELALVGINVMINQWYARFYNALQERHWGTFVSELQFFCLLAAAFVVLAVYQVYLNQWLQIRWRKWLTSAYLRDWLEASNHYRMQLLGDAADNPDQRLADDIRLFIEKTLEIGIGLLSAVVTLGSFVVILWMLSNAAPLHLFGTAWNIPGYLVWAALIYAIIGTVLTHLIGWPLVRLNFDQQRYEADFRFNLVRVRENAEQIALLAGEAAERERLLDRFSRVVGNWMLIMSRTKRLTFFTASYSQAAVVFPFVVASPAYFAGAIQLGGLMQTASAFNSVERALAYFITSYRQLAEWRAVMDRLTGFSTATVTARRAATTQPVIEVAPTPEADALRLDQVEIRLPGGRPLVNADAIDVAPGDRVLVSGPTGAGKSSLFRAIAGIWPFGRGRVSFPRDARLMLLPQHPYFPVATLADAMTYPATAGSFDHTQLAEALHAVGLPALVERLDKEAHWNRTLSPGEQQRLAIARVLLQAPDILFLDEATASLDEPSEAALYKLLQERLPATTIVSIGHRRTLAEFHNRRLALERSGDRFEVRQARLDPAG